MVNESGRKLVEAVLRWIGVLTIVVVVVLASRRVPLLRRRAGDLRRRSRALQARLDRRRARLDELQFGFGIPYWIWVALPELFPEHLPDGQPGRGYASFGHDLRGRARSALRPADRHVDAPRCMGIDRVYFNCARLPHRLGARGARAPRARSCSACPPTRSTSARSITFLDSAAARTGASAPSRMVPKIERARGRCASASYRGRRRLPARRASASSTASSSSYVGVSMMREQLLTLTSAALFHRLRELGAGPRRHLQRAQGAARLSHGQGPRARADRQRGLPVRLEPEGAQGHAAALGRQQLLAWTSAT